MTEAAVSARAAKGSRLVISLDDPEVTSSVIARFRKGEMTREEVNQYLKEIGFVSRV